MGIIVNIEGSDGSGKKTQADLLRKKLAALAPVEVFTFPDDNSFLGKFIRGLLHGKGISGAEIDFRNLPPEISSLPYMLERLARKERIMAALARGNVLLDRYVPSNIAFQAAKLSQDEQGRLIGFIERVEYGELGLPRPTIVIYLDVAAEKSRELMAGRVADAGGEMDQHERDLAFQESVANVYRRLAKARGSWQAIDCLDGSGEILSREAIAAKVWETVQARLP